MINIAAVKLWGENIGTVMKPDDSDYTLFEYDKTFLKSGIELSPVTMPLSDRVYSFPELDINSFHGLPGLLSDSIPDKWGNAIIEAWQTKQGRSLSELTAIDRLCYTGKRGMGALEYEPVIGIKSDIDQEVNVSAMVELASKILSERENAVVQSDSVSMEQIMQVGTSAGGARAKAIIAWNPESGEIRSGQLDAGEGFDYWIMKFDGIVNNGDKEGADKPEYCLREYAYYLMATDAGINMSESKLYEENDRSHFMTRRFDRNPITHEKIHMQSLAAIAHYDFNNPGANSYEQAAYIMRRMGLGQNEIKQLYRRMVFNIFARNNDDHVKNISFLMSKDGVWSLSPAYDITYAYNPNRKWTGMHQMSMNEKRDSFTDNDFEECARNMDIKIRDAKNILNEVKLSVSRWEEFAHCAHLSEKQTKYIKNNLLV